VIAGVILPTNFVAVASQQAPTSIITEFQIPTSNSGPEAIISTPGQTFWFTEFNAGKIGELFGQNGTIHDVAANASGVEPASLAIDKQGRVWFSDTSGHGSIWMYNPATTVFRRFNTITANSFPLSIFIDQANNTWFTEVTADKIGEILSPSYTMVEYPFPTGSGPAGIVHQDGTSLLWVTETYANRIAMFNITDHSVREFTPSQAIFSPLGIVLDQSNNVWIAEHGGSSVDKFFPSNQTLRKYPTSPPTGGYTYTAPATITLDSRGRLWFVEHLSDRVGRLDPASNKLDEFNGLAPGSYSVFDALDQSGNYWFTENAANKIGMIQANAIGQPQNNPSIVDIITTYLPEVLVAATGVLAASYLVITRRRRIAEPSGITRPAVAAPASIGTIAISALLVLSLLSGEIAAPVAKCIIPPGGTGGGGGGGSTGPDYFSIALDIGSLGFFGLVAYLMWRDWRRKKGRADLAK
jgi:virginiamycin B lyase